MVLLVSVVCGRIPFYGRAFVAPGKTFLVFQLKAFSDNPILGKRNFLPFLVLPLPLPLCSPRWSPPIHCIFLHFQLQLKMGDALTRGGWLVSRFLFVLLSLRTFPCTSYAHLLLFHARRTVINKNCRLLEPSRHGTRVLSTSSTASTTGIAALIVEAIATAGATISTATVYDTAIPFTRCFCKRVRLNKRRRTRRCK